MALRLPATPVTPVSNLSIAVVVRVFDSGLQSRGFDPTQGMVRF